MDQSEGLTVAVRAVLAAAPAGFVTDLDGTLSPIVDRPDAARLAPGAADVLADMAGGLAIVAVVTGRSAAAARGILGRLGRELLIVGNHGLEWLPPGADEPESSADEPQIRASLSAGLNQIPLLDGVTVEDKGLSATLHYRGARDAEATRAQLLAALRQVPAGLEVREGRRSVELRPTGYGDKGHALARIAERYRLRGLLVAGDDVTDIDMFRAADVLRGRGLAILAVAVAGGSEVPRDVADAADATVASPDSLIELLRAAIAPPIS
jgi:trehalose 6-phosphate phosphatase